MRRFAIIDVRVLLLHIMKGLHCFSEGGRRRVPEGGAFGGVLAARHTATLVLGPIQAAQCCKPARTCEEGKYRRSLSRTKPHRSI